MVKVKTIEQFGTAVNNMDKNKPFLIKIKKLRFERGDVWLKAYADKSRGGDFIEYHPLYLALRGNIQPLDKWCSASGETIWLLERIDALIYVLRSLIRFGQLEPIVITKDNVIVTGHKRACCLLIMGKKTIKAVYQEDEDGVSA